MYDENKIWIIDLGETIDPEKLRVKTPTTAVASQDPLGELPRPAPQQGIRPAPQQGVRPAPQQGVRPAPRQAVRPAPRGVLPNTQQPTRRPAKAAIIQMNAPAERSTRAGKFVRTIAACRHPERLLVATYLLGPFAMLLTPQGRRDRKWSSSALLAGAAGLFLLIRWGSVQTRMAVGESSVMWFIAAGAVIGLSLVTWSRAIVVTGRMLGAPQTHRLPYWLRQPWATGLAGLVVPGLGHLIAGRARRAAAALCLLGPTLVAALILTHADRLWLGHQALGVNGSSGLALERVFLLAAATLVLGGLTWVALALDSARLQGVAPALCRRQRGDWFAGALVLTLIVSAVALRPAGMAQRLDHYAVALQDEGLQLVPLWLERSAAERDPAQPIYMLRCADLYAALGQTRRATRLRENLDERWVTYATMLRAENWTEAAQSAETAARQRVTKPVAVSPGSSTANSQAAPKSTDAHRSAAASAVGDQATGQPALIEPTTDGQIPATTQAKLRTPAGA